MIHDIHKEKYFEDDIESSLTANGWQKGINKEYSSQLALYPSDVISWVKIHQAKDYERLVSDHRGVDNANNLILQKLSENLNKHGALYVLKNTILRWVDLHPDNVGQKVAIIVEHFRKKVRHLMGGEAKAMVVTSSRLKAKRFKEAIDDYIARNEYDLKTLVAFSGSLLDPEKDGDKEFDENVLNPVLNGRDLSNALTAGDGDKFTDWHCLVVANKFQTGFDEPLLCGMYVDKKLSGVATVQTLSRLNRTCVLTKNAQTHIKDTTYILDFVNDPADIKKAFSLYYTDAELEDVTDPNLIDDCQIKLDEFTLPSGEKIYYQDDIENVIKANFINNKPDQIVAALQPSVKRFANVRERLKSDYQGCFSYG